jgi:hypothetical protein
MAVWDVSELAARVTAEPDQNLTSAPAASDSTTSAHKKTRRFQRVF